MNEKNQEKYRFILIFLNRYYFWLAGVVFILVITLGYFKYLAPTYQEMNNLEEQQLPNRQQRLSDLEKYQKELTDLAQGINQLETEKKQDIEKLNKILPTSEELPDLFAQMENIIETNGFDLLNINFGEPKAVVATPSISPTATSNDDLSAPTTREATAESVALAGANEPLFQTIDIDINIEGGGYLAIKNLLDKIEKHLRIFDVTSINFNSFLTTTAEEQVASYALNLKAYYLP